MVGQETLKETLKTLVNEGKLPRFVVIEGDLGSGKKTLARWLINEMGCKSYILNNVKIDTIREMINNCYNTRVKMVVLIPDADKMSLQAKNSLLKVVEEPPNKVQFILTTIDSEMLLSTIKSRATVFRMGFYSNKELLQYSEEAYPLMEQEEKAVLGDVCRNPYDVQLFVKYGGMTFLEFIDKVLEHVSTAPLYNTMKLVSKIALKEDAEGYDLGFFWNAFVFRAFQKSMQNRDECPMFTRFMRVTLNVMKDLSITGINKQMLFDKWLIDLQEEG